MPFPLIILQQFYHSRNCCGVLCTMRCSEGLGTDYGIIFINIFPKYGIVGLVELTSEAEESLVYLGHCFVRAGVCWATEKYNTFCKQGKPPMVKCKGKQGGRCVRLDLQDRGKVLLIKEKNTIF